MDSETENDNFKDQWLNGFTTYHHNHIVREREGGERERERERERKRERERVVNTKQTY